MRDLNIAYGNSRTAKFWSNKTIKFDELCERLCSPIYTSESAEEYPKLPKGQRDDIKDKGGFVAGHLSGNRRQANKVVCRSMLVYDLDSIEPEFLKNIGTKISNRVILSILVDTFFTRVSMLKLQYPVIHNISVS